jgi:hypothetical protein
MLNASVEDLRTSIPHCSTVAILQKARDLTADVSSE